MGKATTSIIKKGGLYGDDTEEKEMDPTGITRIVKIIINYSKCIHGLTVHFECNGTTQSTDLWGGKGQRADTSEVNFKTNEYITSVNGYVSIYNNVCYVNSLVLKTNLKVYGPYGKEFGESFEFSAPLGGQIIGFHAHCKKDEVNALGVYVRQTNGTIIKKGPFHGSHAIVVKHMDSRGISRIVKISIYHSDKIDALIVHFECNGITQCTDRWGGDGGKLTKINLKTNEYIKSVKGYRDFGILKSLVMETNLDVYGPYGKEKGESFEYTSPLHGQIIGFFAMVRSNYVLRVGVYILQAVISESVPCGGSGGLAREMHQMSAVYRIVKVSIRHGDTIDALSVCYKLQDDTTESTPLWGGETGRLTEIEFEEDEYIKSVRGYVGYFCDIFIVRSLQLITNKRTYRPYGKEEGTPFELADLGGRIIGFHGRSGAYLDAIGVYVKWPKEKEEEEDFREESSQGLTLVGPGRGTALSRILKFRG